MNTATLPAEATERSQDELQNAERKAQNGDEPTDHNAPVLRSALCVSDKALPALLIGRNAIQPVREAAVLQWANGKSMARTAPTEKFQPYIGFHIEVGKDPALDDALDAAHVGKIEIKHLRQGSEPVKVPHWALNPTILFYPVTAGPVAATVAGSLMGRNAALTREAGIGITWGNGERSKLAIRGYLDVLVKVGYTDLIQFSTRSHMTDVLLAALVRHGEACAIVDGLVSHQVAFHELALPLGPGEEVDWGKGDTATVTPFQCLHPAEIDTDYLRTIWRPAVVHQQACADWESIQVWAAGYCSEQPGEQQ